MIGYLRDEKKEKLVFPYDTCFASHVWPDMLFTDVGRPTAANVPAAVQFQSSMAASKTTEVNEQKNIQTQPGDHYPGWQPAATASGELGFEAANQSRQHDAVDKTAPHVSCPTDSVKHAAPIPDSGLNKATSAEPFAQRVHSPWQNAPLREEAGEKAECSSGMFTWKRTVFTIKLHVSKQADIIKFIAETDFGCLLLFEVSPFCSSREICFC